MHQPAKSVVFILPMARTKMQSEHRWLNPLVPFMWERGMAKPKWGNCAIYATQPPGIPRRRSRRPCSCCLRRLGALARSARRGAAAMKNGYRSAGLLGSPPNLLCFFFFGGGRLSLNHNDTCLLRRAKVGDFASGRMLPGSLKESNTYRCPGVGNLMSKQGD